MTAATALENCSTGAVRPLWWDQLQALQKDLLAGYIVCKSPTEAEMQQRAIFAEMAKISLDNEVQTVASEQTMAHNNKKLLDQMRKAGWVTVPEAAKMVTSSTSTIYYWVRRRYVAAIHHGRTVFVEAAWLRQTANCASKLDGGAK